MVAGKPGRLHRVLQIAGGLAIFAGTTLGASASADGAVAPGRLVVEKQTAPQGAPDDFDFDGALEATLHDDESAGKDVPAGVYTVTEDLSDDPGWHVASIVCDDANSTASAATGTATIRVEAGETVRCVFTNERDSWGRIEVEKRTLPGGAIEEFDFDAAVEATLHDGESAGKDVPSGTYTVIEDLADTPGGPWTLSGISCDDTDSSGDTGSRTATFVVAAGETVRCVFTNVNPELTGSIAVVKDAVGGSGEFTFDLAGEGFSGSRTIEASDTDDGAATFSDLEPGTYTLAEQAEDGFELTSLSCSDGGEAAEGSASVEVSVGAGSTVTCTAVNTAQTATSTTAATTTSTTAGTPIYGGGDPDGSGSTTTTSTSSTSAAPSSTTGTAVGAAGSGSSLPRTGGPSTAYASLGVLLVFAGVALLLTSRRLPATFATPRR